jgi:exodeoxyribonuclease VII large subunit
MKAVSVTQINEYIAKKIDSDFNLRNIAVEGEISGLSIKGHAYFSLKDENCVIRSVVWKNQLSGIPKELLENGRKVTVVGTVRVYAKGGTYSLQVHYMEDAGIGAAKAAFDALKNKLYQEGLFDSKYKKTLPSFPSCIGIVTSTEGDALRDIRKIITKKNDFVNLLVFPCNVQGINAPESICEAIQTANEVNCNERPIDLLIVGRGGGSPEDLQAFNDEGVARAIFASEIPVISAVGHEPDVSISDFVADVRAATPSEAAEIAVPDTDELRKNIVEYRNVLVDALRWKIVNENQVVDSFTKLLQSNMKMKIQNARRLLEQAVLHLREGNPQRILERGYAAVLDERKQIVSNIDDIEDDTTYTILLQDGRFKATVTNKERN